MVFYIIRLQDVITFATIFNKQQSSLCYCFFKGDFFIFLYNNEVHMVAYLATDR